VKVGDLVSFYYCGKKHIGVVLNDNERNHTGVRFFKVYCYKLGIHTNYYHRLGKPMPAPEFAGEKIVEVISQS